jgi:Ankyrin repeats (3 copies)
MSDEKEVEIMLCHVTHKLLRHGLDMEKGYDECGRKAIYFACEHGFMDLVKNFLDHHREVGTISINCMIRTERENQNTTAFHVAHQLEHFVPIVKILLQYGANINSTNIGGNTILHYIMQYDSHATSQD